MDDVMEGDSLVKSKSTIPPLRGSRALEKLLLQQMSNDSPERDPPLKRQDLHNGRIDHHNVGADENDRYKSTPQDTVGNFDEVNTVLSPNKSTLEQEVWNGDCNRYKSVTKETSSTNFNEINTVVTPPKRTMDQHRGRYGDGDRYKNSPSSAAANINDFNAVVTPPKKTLDRDRGWHGLTDDGSTSISSCDQELRQYFDGNLSEPGPHSKYSANSGIPRSASVDTLTGVSETNNVQPKDSLHSSANYGRRSVDIDQNYRIDRAERDLHTPPNVKWGPFKPRLEDDARHMSLVSKDDSNQTDPENYHVSPQPIIRSPLFTNRMSNLADQRSKAVNVYSYSSPQKDTYQGQENDLEKRSELEDTVVSLRHQLSARDQQLKEVQDTRQKLEQQLGAVQRVTSTSEKDRRIDDLIREKENLATEVWRLKKEIEALKSKASQQIRVEETLDGSFEDYNPNNPKVLKRKHEDLQSQIKDLQEAHESTLNQLANSEQEVMKLVDENSELKKLSVSKQKELEMDNRRSRQQYKFGYQSTMSNSRDTPDLGTAFSYELQQLREDMCSLRDRNHQLMQDNIKLTEHLKDLERNIPISTLSDYRHPQSSNPDRNANYKPFKSDQTQSYAGPRDEEDDFMRNRKRITNEFKQFINPVAKFIESDIDVIQREEFSSSELNTRRLSDSSDSTVVLTSANPCGEQRQLPGVDQDFREYPLKKERTEPAIDGMVTTPPTSPLQRKLSSNIRPISPPPSNNLRTISPQPVISPSSQHFQNHHVEESSLTVGKRPFAPRSSADVTLGNIVKFCRHGGKISKGIVMYVGHLPGKNDTYLGLELENEMGKHDGVYEGQRYFQSKPSRGVFVAFTKVVMAWGQ